MPAGARKLSHNICRNVIELGIYDDTPSRVRLVVHAGKRTAPTIDRFPDMPLEKASARKALARQGADPKQTDQADLKLPTFSDCLTGFLADNQKATADPQWG